MTAIDTADRAKLEASFNVASNYVGELNDKVYGERVEPFEGYALDELIVFRAQVDVLGELVENLRHHVNRMILSLKQKRDDDAFDAARVTV